MRALNAALQTAEQPQEMLSSVGQSLTTLLDLQFRESKDPYGRPWVPLTSRQGQPLRNTGQHLANTVNYQVDGSAVEVGVGFRYAATHQYGATIRPVRARKLRFRINGREVFADEVTIPARPILPLNGLPQEWNDEITDTMAFHLGQAFRP
jgi:phage gpG-like protein